ncbi:MAG: hypothetical protein JWQ69_1058 [Pseudomonas sp.]|nr:hypothetical protein [Pseudomonas sp.]
MKLILDFNGAQLAGNNLQEAIAAAGVNTSINVNTAQAIPIGSLLTLIQTAAGKNLNIDFNGTQLNGAALLQTIIGADENTIISISSAHSAPIEILTAAFSTGGNKKLNAHFIGNQLVGDHLLQTIIAAGVNSHIRVNTAQAIPVETLLTSIRAAESKKFSATFNGAQLVGDNLTRALATASMSHRINVNTAQAIPVDSLLATIQLVGNKNFGADFNGAQLASDHLERAISVAGVNTEISVNTAQAVPINTLLTAIQIAGSKQFSLDFNGAQLTGDSLQQTAASAGPNATLNVSSAEAAPINTILSAIEAAGNKSFNAHFDGITLVVQILQQAVSAAGANTTILLGAAQAVPLATLLAAIAIAGQVFKYLPGTPGRLAHGSSTYEPQALPQHY